MAKTPKLALSEVTDFIKHFARSKSTRGHGIHSPFVYELATRVFRDTKESQFQPIVALRKQLSNDARVIQVNDLGAGSRVPQGSERKVKSIVQHSTKNDKTGRLLYRLAAHLPAAKILELGTSLGLTTAYLAQTGVSVLSIEGCPEIATIARENFQKLGLKNIELITGNFDEHLETVLDKHPDLNFVFVDGNHSYNATIKYYSALKNKLRAPSAIIFDDIYWSAGMKKAWCEIKADPANQITIDLYHVGLVFFKNSHAKEHFSIRL